MSAIVGGERLNCTNLVLKIASRNGSEHIVVCPEMKLAAGVHVLVGPNGCGKSTLCKAIARIYRPESGSIEPSAGVPPLYVWQEAALFPVSVKRNLKLAASKVRRAVEREAQIADALELFRLRRYAGYFPWQLSGGMAQRAALARAWVASGNRGVVIFDEPTQETDVHLLDEFVELLRRLQNDRRDMGILIVTHDHQLVMELRSFSATLWSMVSFLKSASSGPESEGAIWYVDQPHDLLNAIKTPPTPHFARFVGFDNVFGVTSGDARSLHRLHQVDAPEAQAAFCAMPSSAFVIKPENGDHAKKVARKALIHQGDGNWAGIYEIDRNSWADPIRVTVQGASEAELPLTGWIALRAGREIEEIRRDQARAGDVGRLVEHVIETD